jgi:hypothetical protein
MWISLAKGDQIFINNAEKVSNITILITVLVILFGSQASLDYLSL